jgi:hypothetical protein
MGNMNRKGRTDWLLGPAGFQYHGMDIDGVTQALGGESATRRYGSRTKAADQNSTEVHCEAS